MMTNLMTILERKAFISSNPRIVLSSCPPPCGHFSIQESATGGLSYKLKKGHLERFILNDLISHKRQEPCSSYFFLPDFSETKFFYLFYRHKYKSQNHNNTRYSMRQQFIFCILCCRVHIVTMPGNGIQENQ